MTEKLMLPALRAIAWAYYFQPRKLQALIGGGAGRLLGIGGFRGKVVDQNLGLAYPGEDEAMRDQRLSVRSESYANFGRLGLEILMLLGPMRKFVEKHGEMRGLENWKRASDQGKGVLFLSSHVGNWEIMAAIGAAHGIDLMLVTKHLKPEWLHQAIEKGRLACGVKATYEPRTMRDVLSHLKKKGTVGIVLDQYAGAPVGVRVPFFGIPVSTNTALALLARRTGAAVVPVVNYREPSGKVVVEIMPAIEWVKHQDPDYELAANTAHYTEIIERHVRTHPGQWLWTHRRFKGDLSPLKEDEWTAGRSRK